MAPLEGIHSWLKVWSKFFPLRVLRKSFLRVNAPFRRVKNENNTVTFPENLTIHLKMDPIEWEISDPLIIFVWRCRPRRREFELFYHYFSPPPLLSPIPSSVPGRVAQSVGHLTRKSGVLGSIPSLATYFRFSFRFFKKGSCRLLAKLCARSTG